MYEISLADPSYKYDFIIIRHQFLMPAQQFSGDRYKMNYLHCPQSFVKSIALLSVSASEAILCLHLYRQSSVVLVCLSLSVRHSSFNRTRADTSSKLLWLRYLNT